MNVAMFLSPKNDIVYLFDDMTVRQAMENSVELRTENTTIMQNLKSIKDMIEVVLEKGIQ